MELSPLNPVPETNNVTAFIGHMLCANGIIRAFHLTEKSYARHKALDYYYKTMPAIVDKFAEVYISCHTVNIECDMSIKYDSPETLLGELYDMAMALHPTLQPDLTNPLEDILSEICQTLYLLKLV